MELTIDFESRSPIDIKSCGLYVYWMHKLTIPTMLSIKIDQEKETRLWIPEMFRHHMETEVSDEELELLLARADTIIAHNAPFEFCGCKYGLPRMGIRAEVPLEKLRCTAAQSLMCGYPRSLDDAAKCIGLSEKKDKEGNAVMLKFAKPRNFVKDDCVALLDEFKAHGYVPSDADWKAVKAFQLDFIRSYALTGVTDDPWLEDVCLKWYDDTTDFRRMADYARQDVVVERMIYDTLPHIPKPELDVWVRNEKVNERGIRVDRESAASIIETVEAYSEKLMDEVRTLTGGLVTSMKAPASIRNWLRLQGIDIDSIRKDDVDFLLGLDLAPNVRRFLEIRKQLGRSATAKYTSLLNYSSADGRFRGGFLYHQATTGRFAGTGPQLQNLPRPSETNHAVFKEAVASRDDIALLTSKDFDFIELFWRDPMVLAADLIRPTLIAAEGHTFISADYSAVEARGLAWLAGQEDVLEGFRQGKDYYKLAASGIFGIPYEQVDGGGKGRQRQVGKVASLAAGYGGGVKSMEAFGATRMGLTPEECESIIKAWRASNTSITTLWYDLQKGSMKAMRFPGERVYVRRKPDLSFIFEGGFLKMKLPSGRNLFYPEPEIEDVKMPWTNEAGEPVLKKMVTAKTLTAAKVWVRRPLSHVNLTENAVQALCRDLLVYSWARLEEAGFPLVAHIHDEVVCEIPLDMVNDGTLEQFEGIMSQTPPWAEGFPLKAEGWIDSFYHK